MPIGSPLPLSQSGGSPQSSVGASLPLQALPFAGQYMEQIVGLVPLIPCDYSDCRETQQNQCYYVPVFGNVVLGTPVADPTYENDVNPFGLNLKKPLPDGGYINTILQKAADPYFTGNGVWNWQDQATINDNSCGIFRPVGSVPYHPNYFGYDINWGKVVNLYGPGFYRIKFELEVEQTEVEMAGGHKVYTKTISLVECLVSEPFILRAWDCLLADKTVKFETWATGAQGSIDEYFKMFDLCNIQWYDSIRVPGFFGKETTPKYDETILEYNTGLLEEVRNKLYNRFKFSSDPMPKWVHDRLKSYGLMADTILVSDYNYNNSDYTIKRQSVRRDGSYEPTYLDPKRFDAASRWMQRRSYVNVDFREGVESVVKTLCCLPSC